MQTVFANMAAEGSDKLMNKRYEEAFGLIKYIFNVDKLYGDQIRLIQAFVRSQNIYFNAPMGYGRMGYIAPMDYVFRRISRPLYWRCI